MSKNIFFLLLSKKYITPVDSIDEKNSFRALNLKEVLFFKNKDHFILGICPVDERKCV